jgi:predicted GIY-YIG superfamily endonuclease
METIKIYSLEDANTVEIRYIGYTTKSLNERLKKHFNNVHEAFNLKKRKINKSKY